MSEQTVRVMSILCGVSKGAGRRCRKPVEVVGRRADGELVGAPQIRINGTAYRLGSCPRHGVVVVSEDDIRRRWRPGAGIEARQRIPLRAS